MNTQQWKFEARRAGRAVLMGVLAALALVPHPSLLQLTVGAASGLATVWYVDRADPPPTAARQ